MPSNLFLARSVPRIVMTGSSTKHWSRSSVGWRRDGIAEGTASRCHPAPNQQSCCHAAVQYLETCPTSRCLQYHRASLLLSKAEGVESVSEVQRGELHGVRDWSSKILSVRSHALGSTTRSGLETSPSTQLRKRSTMGRLLRDPCQRIRQMQKPM